MTRSRTIRWGSARKREIAASILNNERTADAVLAEYPDLSREELDTWIAAYRRGGGARDTMSMAAMIKARKAQVPA